jgi:hypothetical protein
MWSPGAAAGGQAAATSRFTAKPMKLFHKHLEALAILNLIFIGDPLVRPDAESLDRVAINKIKPP